MFYTSVYHSPVGTITLACRDGSLAGLWMEGQKYFGKSVAEECIRKDDEPVLIAASRWLEAYFGGGRPPIADLPLAPNGSGFRQEVWRILCEIPYGEVTTYGAIARTMAVRLGRPTMSSQAVGGAVGHNPVSIIIPCHRVVGSNGSLTGYAGGIGLKIKLLELEGVNLARYFVPKTGTAL